MTTRQKKSGHSTSVSAQRSSDRADFGIISIAQTAPKVDYPRPPKKKSNLRAVKALRFSGNAVIVVALMCWLRLMGKSDFNPGYPVRSVLLNALLCICIGMLGLILHRIKRILMEEF